MPESLWNHHKSKDLDFYIEAVPQLFSDPKNIENAIIKIPVNPDNNVVNKDKIMKNETFLIEWREKKIKKILTLDKSDPQNIINIDEKLKMYFLKIICF